MASPGTYAASAGGNAAPVTPPASGATGDTFPTQMSVAQFAGDYGVSSTDMPVFESGGQLNQTAAQELISYENMTQGERQQVQEAMVQAGLLAATSATGVADDSTAKSAFIRLIGASQANGQSVTAYLSQVGQGGLGTIENQISGNLTAAQKTLSSSTSVAATLENPTTLTADITTAFDNALGYAPDPKQIQAFISQIQGQDVSYAEGAEQQNRAQAQADVNQATTEQTALKNLGADGVDAFLSAYRGAVHGGVRGPQVGTVGQVNPLRMRDLEGPYTPGHNPYTQNAAGQVTAQPMVGNTVGGATRIAPAVGSEQARTGGAPVYGGEYALAPAMWDQGLGLLGTQGAAWRKKYATPGSAPVQVQQSVATALADHFYQQSGSWASVATTMAAGSPGAKGNVGDFANSLASAVDSQLTALQNEVNAQPTVTTKVTAPDATAEAALAAKQADPVGYEAANYAAAGDLLSRMLQGAPQLADYSTTDTFSGPAPVPSAAQANGTGA